MFSVQQKREIASAVQSILRSTNHSELPTGEIQFHLHVEGAESWSWADIRNNGAVTSPGVNPHNERQALLQQQEVEIRGLRAQQTPVPVSERLPGPDDRNTEGRCWWFCTACPGEWPHWIFGNEAFCDPTHWLPAHALPLPQQETPMTNSLPWSTEPNVSGRYLCLRDGVFTLYDIAYYHDLQMGISQWEATEVCKGTRAGWSVSKLQPAYWLLVTALPLPQGEAQS